MKKFYFSYFEYVDGFFVLNMLILKSYLYDFTRDFFFGVVKLNHGIFFSFFWIFLFYNYNVNLLIYFIMIVYASAYDELEHTDLWSFHVQLFILAFKTIGGFRAQTYRIVRRIARSSMAYHKV